MHIIILKIYEFYSFFLNYQNVTVPWRAQYTHIIKTMVLPKIYLWFTCVMSSLFI